MSGGMSYIAEALTSANTLVSKQMNLEKKMQKKLCGYASELQLVKRSDSSCK